MNFKQAQKNQKDRNSALDKAISLFSNITGFWEVYNSALNDYLVTEKPDFIDQSTWDLVFAKVPLKSMLYDPDIKLYCGIVEDYIIGFHKPGIFYLFSCGDAIDFSRYSIVPKREYVSNNINKRTIPSSLRLLYETAQDIYKPENVSIEPRGCNPNLQPFRGSYYIGNKFSIFIKHDPLWVEDNFSLRYRLDLPFTELIINDTGGLTFYFLDLEPDYFAFIKSYNHSHISTGTSNLWLTSICKGSGSPINSAIATYVGSPSEDNAYNLFLNYNNLLSQESEAGGPHRRMRKYFLNSSSNNNRSILSTNELEDLIKREVVGVNVNISNSINVSIDRDSINSYLASLSEGSDNSQKILKKDNNIYSFQLNARTGKEVIFWEAIFNGEKVTCIAKEHNPERFDFSGVQTSTHWMSLSKMPPSTGDIQSLESHFSRILTNHLAINRSTIKAINYDTNFPKELFGIKEVSRNTEIENLF